MASKRIAAKRAQQPTPQGAQEPWEAAARKRLELRDQLAALEREHPDLPDELPEPKRARSASPPPQQQRGTGQEGLFTQIRDIIREEIQRVSGNRVDVPEGASAGGGYKPLPDAPQVSLPDAYNVPGGGEEALPPQRIERSDRSTVHSAAPGAPRAPPASASVVIGPPQNKRAVEARALTPQEAASRLDQLLRSARELTANVPPRASKTSQVSGAASAGSAAAAASRPSEAIEGLFV